jgi:transglutaminase-like putative cysteine protease
VQYRPTGTTTWSGGLSVVGATVFELTALQPFKLPQAATSYDIIVQAQNAAGAGPASSLLTAMTSGATGQTAPSQVVGLAASPASSSSVQLSWSNPGRLGARDELYCLLRGDRFVQLDIVSHGQFWKWNGNNRSPGRDQL